MARSAAARLRSAADGKRFVSYIRVSTGKQAIGPEAQRDAVNRHLAAAAGTLIAEFAEVETGTSKRDRPQLAAALAECRLRRAILVIAKLDRLARNVYFVAGLLESGVEFVACDNPHATTVLIHVMAAFAEYEAKAISQRTKEALAVVKAEIAATGQWTSRRSGKVITKLGNPALVSGVRASTRRARAARTIAAKEHAEAVKIYVDAARNAGCSSLSEIAEALTARGIKTPAGLQSWCAEQVRRVIARSN